MESKGLLQSKTFWVNVVSLIAAVLAAFNIDFLTPEMQTSVVAGIMTVVNIVMRLVSSDKVTITGKSG